MCTVLTLQVMLVLKKQYNVHIEINNRFQKNRSLINIAKAGFFSADRQCEEYAVVFGD